MDLFDQLGPVALGSRLRRLGERFASEARLVNKRYGNAHDPKAYPIIAALSLNGSLRISELAELLGQSHSHISQVVKHMTGQGIATSEADEGDARATRVRLHEKAKDLLPRFEEQNQDARGAVEDLLAELGSDFWNAIVRLEKLLDARDFSARVAEARRKRVLDELVVRDYLPEDREIFRRLNYEWIEKYFVVEDADRKVLEDPEGTILAPGGCILMAVYRGKIVGTCALIKTGEKSFELVKLTVSEEVRGNDIGLFLGQAIVTRARELGAKYLYLESNSKLKPALAVYERLGFRHSSGHVSPYARANIQMELDL